LTSILYRTLNRHFHALEESEERYEVAVIGANEGIWDWDISANRIYYSPRFGELLGYVSTADFRNGFSSIWNQVHPDDENAARADLDRHLKSGKPYDVRVRLRTQAGDYRWYRATGQALWSDGIPYRMAGSISDIHEQLRLQESLLAVRESQVQAQAKLSQYLLSAQEQERKRIANELHDSLGQNLSLITNRAELALRANDLPPQAAYQLEAIARTTSEAIADIRRMLGNLLPQQIESVGLTAAIVDLAATLAETSKIAIEHHVDDIDDVFTGNSATHVYRIIQESLHNVIKHAAARRVVLNIERDVRHVRIAIHDDGQGFELNDASSRRGIGLTSLAERAHILGGQFSIASTLGQGTAVMRVIPIAEETATVAVADETASFT